VGQNKNTETWLPCINCFIGTELSYSEEFRTLEVGQLNEKYHFNHRYLYSTSTVFMQTSKPLWTQKADLWVLQAWWS